MIYIIGNWLYKNNIYIYRLSSGKGKDNIREVVKEFFLKKTEKRSFLLVNDEPDQL